MRTVKKNMKHDYQNAIQWFSDNGIRANPNKFQFTVIYPKPLEPQNVDSYGGVLLLNPMLKFRVLSLPITLISMEI